MSDGEETRNSARMVDVSIGGDNQAIDRGKDSNVAVITGAGGTAVSGLGGFAYAGEGGTAQTNVYGVAMAGNRGRAKGGAGCVVFAFDGGSAEGGDGAVAVARRAGNASCGRHGMASALDGNATASGPASVAVARWRNQKNVTASAATGGVAIARNHETPGSGGPALARAASGAIAIAFEDNHVAGDMGALLVGTYRGKDGSIRFATAVVDGKAIRPGVVYEVDRSGAFVAVT